MKIKALIIEDEPLVRERIRDLLEEDAGIVVVDQCKNGQEGISAIRKHQPDLLFLDIQMPLKNGFEVLESIPAQQQPITIFVTAFDQYALKAFEFEALDYLLKPFNRERFMDSLARAKKRLEEKRQSPSTFPDYFLAKEGQAFIPVPAREIIWATSSGNYVLLHTSRKQFSLRKTLGELEKELNPQHFRRIHRSAIINTGCIARLQHLYQGDYRIELTNGKLLTSSKTYRENLQFLLGKTKESKKRP